MPTQTSGGINPFQKGDAVRLTAEAAGRFPQWAGLTGTVLHTPTKPYSAGVRFPGRVCPTYLAVSFLEPAPPARPAPLSPPEEELVEQQGMAEAEASR